MFLFLCIFLQFPFRWFLWYRVIFFFFFKSSADLSGIYLVPFNSFKKEKALKILLSSFQLPHLKPPLNRLPAKVSLGQEKTNAPRIGFKIQEQQKSMAAADPSLSCMNSCLLIYRHVSRSLTHMHTHCWYARQTSYYTNFDIRPCGWEYFSSVTHSVSSSADGLDRNVLNPSG